MNNKNQVIEATPYADTAYKGKADPYYRNNIAPPEQRKRHLAKGQCLMGVFPRVPIMGVFWDSHQGLQYVEDKNKNTANNYYNFYTEPEELRLPLKSLSQNTKEVIYLSWLYLHVGAMMVLPVYLLILLGFGGWKVFLNNLDVLVIGLGGILFSKYIFRLLDKLKLSPTGHFVIFNRKTGMVEIANDDRTGYHHLPFEQFNAHHRTVHSERGAPSYGFTLLHYKEDLMYQVADHTSVKQALIHWELIKNFMDVSQPLADIPEFERYRAYDPATVTFDKKYGRPDGFWYRVDEKFLKKTANIAFDATSKFPFEKADTLEEALQQGYKVPDIVTFPWREVDNLSAQPIEVKANWFVRYIVGPLFLY